MKQHTIYLAIEIYKQLPPEERHQIWSRYKEGGQGESREWKHCIQVAERMIEDAQRFSVRLDQGNT